MITLFTVANLGDMVARAPVVPPSVHFRVGVDLLAVERVPAPEGERRHRGRGLHRAGAGLLPGAAPPDEHLAARFAAKEAVLKVFGTGSAQRLRWTDVEILSDRAGRPEVQLHGRGRRGAARAGSRTSTSRFPTPAGSRSPRPSPSGLRATETERALPPDRPRRSPASRQVGPRPQADLALSEEYWEETEATAR